MRRLVLALLASILMSSGCAGSLIAAHQAKAHADARELAAAVTSYAATFGVLPPSLEALTRRTELNGATAGPFIREIPAPPPGWSTYSYIRDSGGEFSITTAGEGRRVRAP